ncbi:hypothetical protein A71_244 [Escherichia phage A7_1]|uniref:Uncharacterized protein n=2 Tax=Vequintavirinae TaxID=1911928 RepID=A0AAE9VY66_9CAUD|nr:hypothetical protein A71_244 [Escherichia phage A7_1]UZZ64327.1 hypothetical protein A54_87 [Escherichia phage A5-4]WBF77672.1 hypothetical protein A73_18 [Escherichia phage A73]
MNPQNLSYVNWPNKAEKKENLKRLVNFYREAGHSKVTAVKMAKRHLNKPSTKLI